MTEAASTEKDAIARDPKLPRWVPAWMTERERAAAILAMGIVVGLLLASMVVSFGIFVTTHLR